MLASDLKAFIRSGGFAWPGMYPTYLVMGDGEVIDCQAARENYRQILRSLRRRGTNLQWEPYQVLIHWEGAPLICAHSGREIESAYGEVEA